MGVPDYQSLMLPLLSIANDGQKRVSEYIDELSTNFELSDEEKNITIPSGSQTLIRNRAQWAATYLVKAGLLERPQRGVISITDKGKEIVQSNVSNIDNNFLMSFEGFRDFKTSSVQDNSTNQESRNLDLNETPEELISRAYKSYENNTREEILDLILQSSPLFFERLIIKLFQSMGYGGRGKTIHTGKSGDGGVDGIINEDPLGLEKIYLQAKRYNPDNKIPIDQLRSFSGTLLEQRASKGIFVTTSSFVSSAYEYAKNSTQSIILIDGEELTKLMYMYDVGVSEEHTVLLKKPDIDFFEEI